MDSNIVLPLVIIVVLVVFSIFECVLIAVLMNKIDWLVLAEKTRQSNDKFYGETCSH